jgi:hypothetical protein
MFVCNCLLACTSCAEPAGTEWIKKEQSGTGSIWIEHCGTESNRVARTDTSCCALFGFSATCEMLHVQSQIIVCASGDHADKQKVEFTVSLLPFTCIEPDGSGWSGVEHGGSRGEHGETGRNLCLNMLAMLALLALAQRPCQPER